MLLAHRESARGSEDGSDAQDTLLHPQLPLLVWLMAAVANGYRLDLALHSACLGVVRDLACVPVQECIPAGTQCSLSCMVNAENLHPYFHCIAKGLLCSSCSLTGFS